MRRLIGILVALLGSGAGTALLWYGGGTTVLRMSQFAGEGAGLFPLLAGLGAVLLGVAAFSVRWSSLGVIVAGALHVLFALLVFLVPTSSPAGWFLGVLFDVDPAFGTGGYYAVAFGSTLLIGAALLAVGLMAPRPATLLWRVLSGVGGVLAVGAASSTLAAGGQFYRQTFQQLDWSLGTSVLVIALAAVFGLLLAPAGRSSLGAWISGPLLALAGVVLLVVDPSAYTGLPAETLLTVPVIGWSGILLGVGLTVLGLALGVLLRPAGVTQGAAAPDM